MTTQLLEKIRSASLTEKELINLYNNARERNVQEIVAAIEVQIRGQYPRAANRLLGKKETFALECLQDALKLLEGEVDMKANNLKNGVKPGAPKAAGKKYLNVYTSYRNAAGVGGYLSMEQDTIESEMVAVVGQYKTGTDAFRSENTYTMDAFPQAAAEYARIVKSLAQGRVAA
jgi:hypothetical protein